MYEGIPKEQVDVIDNMYKSLNTQDTSNDNIKNNGDDANALSWILEVTKYLKSPTATTKPTIIFA